MKFTIPVFTLLSLLPSLVSGQFDDLLACRNCKVDVDDADPRIVYSPSAGWTHGTNMPKVEGDQIYYKATYSYARAQGASATFKFTGVGIEYWSLEPSYEVTILIDGETLSSGTGRGSSTSIIASRAFNTSGEHSVTITAATYGTAISPSVGLDRFRIDDGSTPASASSAIVSASSTSSAASPSTTKFSSASRLHSTQAGMALVGSLLSLFLL